MNKSRANIFQLIKFAIVGASSTIISEIIYLIVIFFGGHYVLATLTEFVLSVLYSFLLNNKFVFKKAEGDTRIWWKALLKTYASYSFSYGLNIVLLFLWVDVIGISKYMGGLEAIAFTYGITRMNKTFWGEAIAAFINLIVTVPINFVLNKFWAFKDKKSVH